MSVHKDLMLFRRRRRCRSVTPSLFLPPVDPLTIAWAPPQNMGAGAQVFDAVVGPQYQLGSTSGSDNHDPAHVAGPPAYIQTGSDDYVQGASADTLESVICGATGWWFMQMFERTGTASIGLLWTKDGRSSMQRQVEVLQLNSTMAFQVTIWNALGFIRWDFPQIPVNVKTRVIVWFRPNGGYVSGIRVWYNGVEQAYQGGSASGAHGPVVSWNKPLRIGAALADNGSVGGGGARLTPPWIMAGQPVLQNILDTDAWGRDVFGWGP